MKYAQRLAAVIGIAVLTAFVCSMTAVASFDWQSREGTIRWARGLEDGTHIYLDAVIIGKIRARQTPSYLVIQECFSQQDKLVILSQPDTRLRVGQTVDVSGDLITTDSGDRALVNVTVTGYCDKDGNLLHHGPLIKGLFEPIPWDYKVDLTVQTPSFRSQSESDDPISPPGDVNTDTSTDVVTCDTVSDALAQGAGTVVELQYHPVSSGGTGSFVLGDDDDTDMLPVNYTGTVQSTDRVAIVRGTIDVTDEEGTDKVLDVDSGPNYNVQESYTGVVSAAPQGSIAWVKTWPDYHIFGPGDITAKIVTLDTYPYSYNYIYIEDDNRSNGIRVYQSTHAHHTGERVDVQGTLRTLSSGERYITNSTIGNNGSGALAPLGMNNKSMGGGDFAYTAGPPKAGQRGVFNACGLNNIGLLVRMWGTITELDTTYNAKWFKIDDGSGVPLKIAYPRYGYGVGDFVVMTGASSCELDTNGNLQRVLQVQPLTCTITLASGQCNPTNVNPVHFSIVFSEPVVNFEADDISTSGSGATAATKSITGTGTTYDLAIDNLANGPVYVQIPAGNVQCTSGARNYTSNSSIVFDTTPPTAPTQVVLSHVIPTSKSIHATWQGGSDDNGVSGFLYQFWYKDNTGNLHTLTNQIFTPNQQATYNLDVLPQLTVTSGLTYGIRVWTVDVAQNLSEYVDSLAVPCNKISVGFLFYKCVSGSGYNYSNTNWYIDSYLNNVKYGADCAGKVIYTKLTAAPTSINDYNSYDVLFVALPSSDFTTMEGNALQTFADQGFNKRLVLVGEYGTYSTAPNQYSSGCSANNSRLNLLAYLLNRATRFHVDGDDQDTQPAYDNGIALDYTNHYRDCPVRNHYLTTGVGGLWDAATSAFTSYINPIAAMRDGENAYPGKFWVVDEDMPSGCSFVCIHDCGIFDFEYDNMLQTPNMVGNSEVDYDNVPDRNFKFIENLYTVFRQQ